MTTSFNAIHRAFKFYIYPHFESIILVSPYVTLCGHAEANEFYTTSITKHQSFKITSLVP